MATQSGVGTAEKSLQELYESERSLNEVLVGEAVNCRKKVEWMATCLHSIAICCQGSNPWAAIAAIKRYAEMGLEEPGKGGDDDSEVVQDSEVPDVQ